MSIDTNLPLYNSLDGCVGGAACIQRPGIFFYELNTIPRQFTNVVLFQLNVKKKISPNRIADRVV